MRPRPRSSTGWPGPDALRARVGTGAVVGTLPGAGDRVRGRRHGRRAAAATTTPPGRPWPSRGGWPSRCPRTRAASVWAWSRWRCCARRSGAGWWRRRSSRPSWRSARCAAPEARADAGPRTGARRSARARRWAASPPPPGPTASRSPGRRAQVRLSGQTPPPSPTRPRPTSPSSWPTAASTASTCARRGGRRRCSAMDRTRELGVLTFDGTPARFLGGEEAADAPARPGGHAGQRRDARRGRPRARP